MKQKLVFCTNNIHKMDEVTQIMGTGFQFLTLQEVDFSEEIPEPFFTLEENSLTKSQIVFDRIGIDCFSEDTGLFVEVLNGEPGVLSARYAGETATSQDNIKKLLTSLEGETNRKAYFKTVVTLILDNKIHQFSGECHGNIALETYGNEGFGYDPVFIPENETKSFAEFSAAEKNAISHRKIAFEKFKYFLQENKN